LNGKRLKGGFTLVRMRKDKSGKRENWLLIKQHDRQASEEIDPVQTWQRSVKSRRSMEGIAKAGKHEP
jgi:bifunctional non-homologous end joining protein LigD